MTATFAASPGRPRCCDCCDRSRSAVADITIARTLTHGCLCPRHVWISDGRVAGVDDWGLGSVPGRTRCVTSAVGRRLGAHPDRRRPRGEQSRAAAPGGNWSPDGLGLVGHPGGAVARRPAAVPGRGGRGGARPEDDATALGLLTRIARRLFHVDSRMERELMRAIVTGAAGFIGSHLCERAARRRRRGGRDRLLHRLLLASAQGGQRRAAAASDAASRCTEVDLVDGASGRPARARRRRLSPGRPAGRACLVGQGVRALRQAATSWPPSASSRPRATSHSGRSSTRPARRCTATRRPTRRPRTCGRSRCRRTASPSWRPSTSASSTAQRRTDGLPALLHRVRAAAAPGHGLLTAGRRGARTASRSCCTATASRAVTSPMSTTS